jgi:hypothetical protein
MDISTAVAILEDAVKRSQTENVNTPEVLAALDFVEALPPSAGHGGKRTITCLGSAAADDDIYQRVESRNVLEILILAMQGPGLVFLEKFLAAGFLRIGRIENLKPSCRRRIFRVFLFATSPSRFARSLPA